VFSAHSHSDCLIYSLCLKLGSTLPPHSERREYIYSLEQIIIWSPVNNQHYLIKNKRENSDFDGATGSDFLIKLFLQNHFMINIIMFIHPILNNFIKSSSSVSCQCSKLHCATIAASTHFAKLTRLSRGGHNERVNEWIWHKWYN